MRIQMDNVLWQFAKYYHQQYLADHPGAEMSLGVIVLGMLQAMEKTGDASRQDHSDGGATWKATTSFFKPTTSNPGQ